MHSFQVIHATRIALGVSLAGMITVVGGCSDNGGTAAVSDTPAAAKAREDKQQEARLKNFGPKSGGNATRGYAEKLKTNTNAAAKP